MSVEIGPFHRADPSNPVSVFFHGSGTLFTVYFQLLDLRTHAEISYRVVGQMCKCPPNVAGLVSDVLLAVLPGVVGAEFELYCFAHLLDCHGIPVTLADMGYRPVFTGDTIILRASPVAASIAASLSASTPPAGSTPVAAGGPAHCVRCGVPNEYQPRGFTCWKCSRS